MNLKVLVVVAIVAVCVADDPHVETCSEEHGGTCKWDGVSTKVQGEQFELDFKPLERDEHDVDDHHASSENSTIPEEVVPVVRMTPDGKIKSDVFVAIVSWQGREAQRAAIRETWVTQLAGLQVQYRFFLGGHSAPLDEHHGDVILLRGVDDTHDGLTQKSFAAFAWITSHISFDHLVKVRDETFVLPRRLMPRVRVLEAARVYRGFVYTNDEPIRGDEMTSEKEYPWVGLPPYVESAAYVLSVDVVKFLAHNVEYAKESIQREDIALAHWLSAIKIYPQEEPTFIPGWSDAMTRTFCRSDLTTLPHLRCPRTMRAVWNLSQVETFGSVCTSQMLPGQPKSCEGETK